MIVTPKLINDCIQRDEKACKELFFGCYNRLMNISYRYQSNEIDAKDVVNATFMKIITNLHKYKIGENFESWSSRICINTNIDLYRKRKSRNEKEQSCDDYIESSLMNIDVYNKALDKLNTEHLHDLIKNLPPTSREVFNLFAVEGYSHKEISDLIGISEGASRWHMSEARKQLKAMIKKQIAGSEVRDYE